MIRSDADYINFNPFQGDEAEISCRGIKIRVARKPHQCFFGLGEFEQKHEIKPGDRYRYEKALVDKSFWGEYRLCLACIDKYLDEIEGIAP